ncbi:hypothetical protein [Micromonospora sp. NPDC049282]|uniref:hypothetical protein n=1 Tax=Micromonospora sp. NPDC049282 TaxID=3364269 RepID=UPI00370FDE2D
MQTYIAPHTISLLAKVLAEHAATYRAAADQAEPVTIAVPNAGHLLAAIGVARKLATERTRTDPTDAAGIRTGAADAVAGLGAQLAARTSADEPVIVSGPTPVFSRSVLTRVIDRLTTGSWTCPCREPHPAGKPCTMVRGLTRDLNNVGG